MNYPERGIRQRPRGGDHDDRRIGDELRPPGVRAAAVVGSRPRIQLAQLGIRVAQLSSEREIIALDLPGFGDSPPLPGQTNVASLTDAVEAFISAHSLGDVDVVGSSMGARMVLEMARRGHAGSVVALDPGGFWTDNEVKLFGATVGTSIALVRRIQPLLPALTRSRVGRTALLLQFSAKPWRLPPELVLQELRSFARATRLDEALHALVRGPEQQGAR